MLCYGRLARFCAHMILMLMISVGYSALMMLYGQVTEFTGDTMWHELIIFYLFQTLLLCLKDLNDFMVF